MIAPAVLLLVSCVYCDKIELNFVWRPNDRSVASSVLIQQHLQALGLQADKPSSVVTDDAIPSHDDLLEWIGRRRQSCAIIGNSALLNGAELGDEIDAHDVTLRFNWAPISRRFARDVGTKTTIMMLNLNKAMLVVENQTLLSPYVDSLQFLWINAHNRFVPYRDRFWSDLAPFLQLSNKLPTTTIKVRFLSEQWKAMSTLIVNEISPPDHEVLLEAPKASSGMMAIAALYSACDTVDLYGFGATENEGYGHYWDSTAREELESFRFHGSPSHAFSREQTLMMAMNASTFDSPTFRAWMKPTWTTPPRVCLHAVASHIGLPTTTTTTQLQIDSLVVVVAGDADSWLGIFASVRSVLQTAVLRELYRYAIFVLVPEHETASLQRQIRCVFREPFAALINVVGVPSAISERLKQTSALYPLFAADLLPRWKGVVIVLDVDAVVMQNLASLLDDVGVDPIRQIDADRERLFEAHGLVHREKPAASERHNADDKVNALDFLVAATTANEELNVFANAQDKAECHKMKCPAIQRGIYVLNLARWRASQSTQRALAMLSVTTAFDTVLSMLVMREGFIELSQWTNKEFDSHNDDNKKQRSSMVHFRNRCPWCTSTGNFNSISVYKLTNEKT